MVRAGAGYDNIDLAAATAHGVVAMNNVFEGDDSGAGDGQPGWWRSYNWPWWWNHINGVGRITWKLKLEPGKPVDLGYGWHYFWN